MWLTWVASEKKCSGFYFAVSSILGKSKYVEIRSLRETLRKMAHTEIDAPLTVCFLDKCIPSHTSGTLPSAHIGQLYM